MRKHLEDKEITVTLDKYIYSFYNVNTLVFKAISMDKEDLKQDVYLKLLKTKFKNNENIKGFIITCAYNHMINLLNESKRNQFVEDSDYEGNVTKILKFIVMDNNPFAVTTNKDLETLINKEYEKSIISWLYKKLTKFQSDIFVYRVFWGLKYEEIADKLFESGTKRYTMQYIELTYKKAIKKLKKLVDF